MKRQIFTFLSFFFKFYSEGGEGIVKFCKAFAFCTMGVGQEEHRFTSVSKEIGTNVC